jgi:3,4-dihydroxyphenylacetate 2,3-dioxygenase
VSNQDHGASFDDAPPDVVRAAYAELIVTDLAASRHFWVDRIGFSISAEDSDALYLRGYEDLVHHSLILRVGDQPVCSRIAMRVRTPDDVDRAERWHEARGCPTRRIPKGSTRGVGDAVRVQDPFGFVVEYFHEMEWMDRLAWRYDLRRGASINRLDHINLVVDDVQACYEWYTALGFGLSETIEDDDGTLLATWMYRKQTVHDIATTQGSAPRLHHLAFAVPEAHHILGLCDVLGAVNEQGHIERGPGRHGVSNAFYLYLRDPDGHRVEVYTTDYFTGDPGHPTLRWSVNDERRRDFWGNPVVPRWYNEASRVLDLDGNVVALRERPSDEQRITVGADGLGVNRGVNR